ncbi:F-box protein CPR1-like isoform X3 [Malus sylvestris]|uniref:F-box protein CPR1-like isoform X3 n=1 Tax=Malus sylvestris TaxID=3752 RepID=UPI0021AD3DE9|nr:F-box protein CPR1-like isoform X3 [Malus sylvestris]
MAHNFPEEIIHDILFRLPPKSLIICTSVCKPWNSMIKSPSFIRTHLSRTIDLNNQFGTHLLLLDCIRPLYSYVNDKFPMQRYCSLRYDNLAFDEYCKLEFPVAPKEELRNKVLDMVGVCNGLVLLADNKVCSGNTFILCNPSMRKSVTLPKFHLNIKMDLVYIGFGFDAVTNDYKVVKLTRGYQPDNLNILYEVYSLAGGSWSDPLSLDHICTFNSINKLHAFVNGAIHWIACCNLADGAYECFILAFDVGSDSFHRIMVPKNFRSSKPYQLSVSGYGKSTALCGHYFIDSFEPYLEIWVMKEYGMEESWTKLTALISPGPERYSLNRPLCFRKSGDVVLVVFDGCEDEEDHDRHGLVCLDLVGKQFTNLGIDGYKYHYAKSYVESLVLLDNTDAVSY